MMDVQLIVLTSILSFAALFYIYDGSPYEIIGYISVAIVAVGVLVRGYKDILRELKKQNG